LGSQPKALPWADEYKSLPKPLTWADDYKRLSAFGAASSACPRCCLGLMNIKACPSR